MKVGDKAKIRYISKDPYSWIMKYSVREQEGVIIHDHNYTIDGTKSLYTIEFENGETETFWSDQIVA